VRSLNIAYINEVPEVKSLQTFMQEYRVEYGHQSLWGLDKQVSEPGYVISAYDNNRLIGLGFIPADASEPKVESCSIYVLPAYAKRGIETNVNKLLLAEWKFSPLTVVPSSGLQHGIIQKMYE
jgi:hypothetical protein